MAKIDRDYVGTSLEGFHDLYSKIMNFYLPLNLERISLFPLSLSLRIFAISVDTTNARKEGPR